MIRYRTDGVCATEIIFAIEDDRIVKVEFVGGCPGNLSAISKLVEGMPISEAIKKFKGTLCQNGTSCVDQFARALEEVLAGQIEKGV